MRSLTPHLLECAIDSESQSNDARNPERTPYRGHSSWSAFYDHPTRPVRVRPQGGDVAMIGQFCDAYKQGRQGKQRDHSVIDLQLNSERQNEDSESSKSQHFVPLVNDEFSNKVCHAGDFPSADWSVGVPPIIHAKAPRRQIHGGLHA